MPRTANEVAPEQPDQVLAPGKEVPYVNYMLNAEDALFIGAIICTQPDSVFRGVDVWHQFTRRQGSVPAWPAAVTGPIRTALRSAAPTGAVKKTTGVDFSNFRKGREVTACQAVAAQAEEALAVCGAGMAWSLRHSNISVQRALGRTLFSTSEDGKVEYGAPWVRYVTYPLLINEDRPQSVDELFSALELPGYRYPNFLDQARRMRALGVLQRSAPGHRWAVLSDAYREPISELIRDIHSLRTPKGFQKHANFARGAINDQDAMHQLMTQAFRFSPGRLSADVREGRMPPLDVRILAVMRSLAGNATMRQIQHHLSGDGEHAYTDPVVQDALHRLREAGHLLVEDLSRPKSGYRYTLANPQSKEPAQS